MKDSEERLRQKRLRKSKPIEEISSKDLSKPELFKYVFGPFLKVGFAFIALFFDTLIVTQIYNFIPESAFTNQSITHFFGFQIYYFYFIFLTTMLEIFLVYGEIQFYRLKLLKFLDIDL